MSSTDAALRDLSAASLKEFVHWSIKQSTPQVRYYTVLSLIPGPGGGVTGHRPSPLQEAP